MSQPIAYRQATTEDLHFILSSWLNSFRPSQNLVPDHVYFREQKSLILSLISRSAATVACDPEYPRSIFGYAVVEGNKLHFVYVKHALRRFGVAKTLIEQAGIQSPFEVTHMTPTAVKILTNHPGAYEHNPYGAYQP